MIAACLITKNSEATLEPCLTSIRPHVDGIFIYDTGSTDGTLKLIERLNDAAAYVDSDGQFVEPKDARPHKLEEAGITRVPLAPIMVEQGEWRDDFAWAREQSFGMPGPEYDWLLWLDDDDVVEGGQWLRQLAATTPGEVDGWIVYYDYARDEQGNCVCQLWRERLMRRDRGYLWKGAVHEVLVPPDGRPAALILCPPEQIRYIHHRPPDRYEPDRNLKLLLRDAQRSEEAGEQPDPRTLAYLGTETMSRGTVEAAGLAVGYFARYLEHPNAGWADERAQVRHKLATCLRVVGQYQASAECEFQALRERDDWGETYVGLAESFAMLGDWQRVERWAKRALEVGMPQSTLILNPLEFTFVPLVRLSEAAINTGRYQDAEVWLAKAAAIAPQHPLIAERGAQYAQARAEGEVVNAVMLLRETLIRHDENLKALELLEKTVPYVVQDHPAVVQARAAQRENCRHYLEPDEYKRWYKDEPKESTVTDDFVPRAGEVFHRVGFLEAGLAEQEKELGRKPDVLDLGCNDFWVGAYLTTKGYRCDGVELNWRSYELALDRAERFRNGAEPAVIAQGDLHHADRLLEGRRYDAVSLFEVIEHVPDPEQTLAVCEKLLRPGGRVYVSTPDGAYERGNLARWQVVERKGHLRAWPVHELVDRVNHRGDVKMVDLGQGLAVISYTPRRKRGKVVFYAGGCLDHWSPGQANDVGLGGSETMLVRAATLLAQAGYEVKVYADTDPAISAGGVLWRPHTAWDPTEVCDAMIVSRLPAALDAPIRAPVRALWCHDHSYPEQITEERAAKMTHVIVLSDWQRDRFARLYPYLAEKLVVIRNGIPLLDGAGDDRYPDAERPFTERKPRVVYSSSADRGLDVLLELWPRIRARSPEAELHVFYGFDVLDRAALMIPGLAEHKARVLALAANAGGEEGGVFLRGRVGQAELAREMQDARVWAYPTAFLETSCITAMEARAAGLALVTSDLGALAETVGTHGIRIPWGVEQVCAGNPRTLTLDEIEASPVNATERYRDEFVKETARLLTEEAHWEEWHRKARAGVGMSDWLTRSGQWAAVASAGRKRPGRARKKAAVAA